MKNTLNMVNKTCPLCDKKLSLKQVNLNLAVYICEDLKCKYPVGYDCIVVERKLEDVGKELDNDDLNDWINDIVKENEQTSTKVTVEVQQIDSNQNQSSTDWIDDLVEKAVNEVQQIESSNNEVTGIGNVDADIDDILKFICSN